eukprot:80588-Rhodomonas_salina.3
MKTAKEAASMRIKRQCRPRSTHPSSRITTEAPCYASFAASFVAPFRFPIRSQSSPGVTKQLK